jgi:polar amino acid transport system substrate-binding protein
MKKLLLGLLVCGLAVSSFAAQYKIAGYPIPLMIVDKDNGLFVELVKEMIKRSGADAEIVVFPAPRTVENFAKGEIDGFFPALDVLIEKDKAATDEVIYIKEDYAFTRKGEAEIKSIKDLEGKKVGITAGYPYVNEIMKNPAIKAEIGPDDVSNMQKLSKGRIDVFVVEEKTGLKALEQSAVDNVTYPAGSPLSQQKVYVAFQPTDAGKDLAAKFSAALTEMKKDGTFEKIMAPAK